MGMAMSRLGNPVPLQPQPQPPPPPPPADDAGQGDTVDSLALAFLALDPSE